MMTFKNEARIKVKLTCIEEMLGTQPADAELHSTYIASNAPDAETLEEEIAEHGADAVEEKGMTIFPKDSEGRPFLYDYQVKGFFKGTCGFLRNVPGTESSKIKAYKKKLDGLLFISPRRIILNTSGESADCQRPLRTSGVSGERVALAHSETVPEGTTFEFEIRALDSGLMPFVMEALEYGELSGIGQWRNSGKGRFTYEVIE